MGARKYTVQPPMTAAELQEHDRRQAEERVRRGLVGFTRPEKREEIMGRTSGEARLGTTQRHSQVQRRRGR